MSFSKGLGVVMVSFLLSACGGGGSEEAGVGIETGLDGEVDEISESLASIQSKLSTSSFTGVWIVYTDVFKEVYSSEYEFPVEAFDSSNKQFMLVTSTEAGDIILNDVHGHIGTSVIGTVSDGVDFSGFADEIKDVLVTNNLKAVFNYRDTDVHTGSSGITYTE